MKCVADRTTGQGLLCTKLGGLKRDLAALARLERGVLRWTYRSCSYPNLFSPLLFPAVIEMQMER